MDTAKHHVDDPIPWLTSDEAAKLLHRSPERIRDMIHGKELLAFKVGQCWRIPTSEVMKRIALIALHPPRITFR